MQTQLPLFLKWGIRFGDPYEVPEQAARQVAYVDRFELEQEIVRRRDEGVIISLRLKSKENQRVSLILSKLSSETSVIDL